MFARWLDRVLPLWRHREIALFYVLNVSYNTWFVAGVWAFIWGKFMTNQEIGISDALTFAAGFLLELPSGVIADLMGRKRAVIFGNVLLVVGNLLVALSSSFISITFWYLIWTVGYAFQSGATEALAYDYLKRVKQEAQWPRIIAASLVMSRIASLLCTAIGGFLFAKWLRAPYLAAAAASVIGVIAACLLHEVRANTTVTKKDLWKLKTYGTQIKDGMAVLHHKTVLPLALAGIAVMGVMDMYNWGLLRPLTALRFGYSTETVPLLQVATSLCTITATLFLVRFRKRLGTEKLLLGMAILFALLLAALCLPLSWFIGGLAIIGIGIAGTYVQQLVSVFINQHASSEHRATTLSAVALFVRLPYVIFAILIGWLADKQLLAPFSFGLGLLVLAICAASVWLWQRQRLRTA